jgi:hypothetical protein
MRILLEIYPRYSMITEAHKSMPCVTRHFSASHLEIAGRIFILSSRSYRILFSTYSLDQNVVAHTGLIFLKLRAVSLTCSIFILNKC